MIWVYPIKAATQGWTSLRWKAHARMYGARVSACPDERDEQNSASSVVSHYSTVVKLSCHC